VNFLKQLLNILISNFVKIHPVGAELFHVDRQTEMMKLIVTFVVLQMHLLNSIRKLKIIQRNILKSVV